MLILGGDTVGLYAARRLRRRLGRQEAAIVVVDPRPYMTYAPFLPETAAGSIDPRNVVVPHRRSLKGVDVLQGKVSHIEHATRRVGITPESGRPYSVSYDFLVVGLGSVARTLPIPGLADERIGFKNVEEAIAVRNHVLGRIEAAASTWDPELRRRMLAFVFVGGGFAGVEAIAEVETIARYTVRKYHRIEPDELRFVPVEGTARILVRHADLEPQAADHGRLDRVAAVAPRGRRARLAARPAGRVSRRGRPRTTAPIPPARAPVPPAP